LKKRQTGRVGAVEAEFFNGLLGFERLILVNSYSDHTCMVQQMARTARPTMDIAGNGSCSSGRIVSCLKAIGDNRHNVRASGLFGQAIQTYGPLDGSAVRQSAVTRCSDQNGLFKFVPGTRNRLCASVSFTGTDSNKRWLRG